MSLIDSTRMKELHNKVISEIQRRSIAITDYTYSITPSKDIISLNEHYLKNAIPLNYINSDIIKNIETDSIIKEDDILDMESFITILQNRDKTDTSGSDCRTGCTGLCLSCTGCSGSCSGTCTGSCSGGCSGTCTGCKGTCQGCSSCGYSLSCKNGD